MNTIQSAINDITLNSMGLISLLKLTRAKILDLAIRGKLVEQDENDEPASELLKRINPNWQPSDTSHYPYILPKSWEWVTCKDAFLPMTRQTPLGETFKYIDIDSINNKNNICTPKIIQTSNAPSRASRHTSKGDIVFSMVRPYLRNIAIVEEDDCIASTGFYIFKPSTAINGQYAFYLMLSNYVVEGLNQFMKGDNSPSINNSQIDNWQIPLPPLDEQKRIVVKIEELFAALDSISQALAD